MAGIADLVNSIVDSATGIFDFFTTNPFGAAGKGAATYYRGNSDPLSGGDEGIASLRSNWNKLPDPYTFSVQSIKTGNKSSNFDDFELPIAPREINQDDTPAMSVKATQGGSITNHNGNKFKDLTISGTTGISPYRGTTGARRSDGQVILSPKKIKYRSGYEVFLELRNWFRAYYQYKKDLSVFAQEYRLVFKNYKDGEYLVVELEKFSMKRSADRPMMYDYTLQFKVVGHFKAINDDLNFFEKLDRWIDQGLDFVDSALGIFDQIKNIIKEVEDTYESSILEPLRKAKLFLRAIGDVPKNIGEVFTELGDFGDRILKKTFSSDNILGVLLFIKDEQEADAQGRTVAPPEIKDVKLPTDLGNAVRTQGPQLLTDLGHTLNFIPSSLAPKAAFEEAAKELEEIKKLPRSYFKTQLKEFKRIRDNANDYFGVGSTDYDEQEERIPTLEAEEGKETTDEEFQTLYAFNQSIKLFRTILSRDDGFKGSQENRLSDINDAFDGELDIVAEDSVRSETIRSDMNLEQLALEQLGDSSRWIEIAELNNLKAPYISQDTSDNSTNVLKPGDEILIPSTARNTPIGTPKGGVNESKYKTLSEIEKDIGIDLKLTNDYDLDLLTTGDVDTIAGISNMAQAIVLKILISKGDIVKHPDLGSSLSIGSKFPSISQAKDEVYQTLSSDPRIERIQNLRLFQENSTLTIEFFVILKNSDVPIPVTIKI